jgi:hypothetical protein
MLRLLCMGVLSRSSTGQTGNGLSHETHVAGCSAEYSGDGADCSTCTGQEHSAQRARYVCLRDETIYHFPFLVVVLLAKDIDVETKDHGRNTMKCFGKTSASLRNCWTV